MESPLLTDLYQLTMAAGYWHHGVHESRACFHLFYRRPPFGGSYAVFAGLRRALDYLEGLHFEKEDIEYLRTLDRFPSAFLDMLGNAEFELDVWAMAEGTLAYPHEPMLRVEGPLWQAQLVETALLNFINFETLIATKAARICDVARDADGKRESVLEFGLRRAQGADGGLSASRAAYLGGCSGTSNVLAGQRFGVPVFGTHAHSWIMTFGSDDVAFARYADTFPNRSVFLVDTYDTIAGVGAAIRVATRMREKGHELKGIRLDSGDLAELSKVSRAMLDEAGFPDVQIVASNDLDEYRIAKLKAAGARIDVWGVGTRLSTAYDQPALGGVYKLGAIRQGKDWSPRMKFSETPIKRSIPGRLDVYRTEGLDVIASVDLGSRRAPMGTHAVHPETGEVRAIEGEAELLLTKVMRSGRKSPDAEPSTELEASRERAIAGVDALPQAERALKDPSVRFAGIEQELATLRERWRDGDMR